MHSYIIPCSSGFGNTSRSTTASAGRPLGVPSIPNWDMTRDKGPIRGLFECEMTGDIFFWSNWESIRRLRTRVPASADDCIKIGLRIGVAS